MEAYGNLVYTVAMIGWIVFFIYVLLKGLKTLKSIEAMMKEVVATIKNKDI